MRSIATDLTWLYVEKDVGGRRLQAERVYHEVSAFLRNHVSRSATSRTERTFSPDQDAR
jgi:hypothetical protein